MIWVFTFVIAQMFPPKAHAEVIIYDNGYNEYMKQLDKKDLNYHIKRCKKCIEHAHSFHNDQKCDLNCSDGKRKTIEEYKKRIRAHCGASIESKHKETKEQTK